MATMHLSMDAFAGIPTSASVSDSTRAPRRRDQAEPRALRTSVQGASRRGRFYSRKLSTLASRIQDSAPRGRTSTNAARRFVRIDRSDESVTNRNGLAGLRLSTRSAVAGELEPRPGEVLRRPFMKANESSLLRSFQGCNLRVVSVRGDDEVLDGHASR